MTQSAFHMFIDWSWKNSLEKVSQFIKFYTDDHIFFLADKNQHLEGDNGRVNTVMMGNMIMEFEEKHALGVTFPIYNK